MTLRIICLSFSTLFFLSSLASIEPLECTVGIQDQHHKALKLLEESNLHAAERILNDSKIMLRLYFINPITRTFHKHQFAQFFMRTETAIWKKELKNLIKKSADDIDKIDDMHKLLLQYIGNSKESANLTELIEQTSCIIFIWITCPRSERCGNFTIR
jgi:hypothetical protein